ncbi:hypothetical protein QBC33DRAFT_567467 [Phialemonium atrogriseum]|uniref:O-methyltransferase domain-containing protein n=1 Tax=Phialemonium atrogriseum TaxID=1093897 RepID=A0AAJ0FPH2_9PEZI|nr:uncharacterized protein QBC33DRAFT_567467 [Phialemonium atrogriseum]KAK1770114.1 hypothetical protein QBC33DRAFT_567467 [Phialemonium atrogriseum]
MRGAAETNPKPPAASLPSAIATPCGSDSSGPSSSPTMELSRMLSTSWPSSSAKPSSMFLFTYGPREPHYRTVLRTSLSTGTTPHFSSTVLHGSEDGERAQILRSLIPAIALGSKILIDEMVLPNTGVHWWSASMDLHMYTMLGSMEQNED